MRCVLLMLGPELSATRVSLTDLMERVHSDIAIPPRRKCFLLMFCQSVSIIIHCENSLSTLADICGMDRISSAIDDRFEYIICGDCQNENGLVMDGSVGDERYQSH